MKKTVSINLNGQVFIIDEDAFNELNTYLDSIANRFANTDESAEIISDIEARIAELFLEYISASKQSITIVDVFKVIGILGKPNEFGDESHEQNKQSYNTHDEYNKKRLYRDPDNRIIGGVAAGIAAWMNIDPVIMRVLFVVSFFVFGPLLYFILWIIIPLARTPSQRLEMRGEEVNLNNIERIIREEFQQVKDSLKNLKKKENRRKIEHEFSSIFNGIARVFHLFGKIILGFFVAIFMFVFMIFIGVMTHIIPFDFFTTHCITTAPISNIFHVFISQSSSILLFWGIFLFIGTILLSIIINLVKIITGNYRRWWLINSIFTAITLIGLALIIYSTVKEATHFNISTEIKSRNDIVIQKNDTLKLVISNDQRESTQNQNTLYSINDNGDFSFSFSSNKCHFKKGNLSIYSNPELGFEQSKSDSSYIVISRRANGNNITEATDNCNKINYSFSINKSNIKLASHYSLINTKWRNQKLYATIFIPNGSSIMIERNGSTLANNLKEGQTYTMKNGKLE